MPYSPYRLEKFAVTVYPYRRALLSGPRHKLPRELMHEMEVQLALCCRRPMDNHVTYRVEEKHEEPTFFMFSDGSAYIGGSVTYHPRGF